MVDPQNTNPMRFNDFRLSSCIDRPRDGALFQRIVTIKEVHRPLLGIVKRVSYYSKKRFVDSEQEVIGVVEGSRRSFD